MPASAVHEFLHLIVGKLFKSENASYTVRLDASGVTEQSMRPIGGPITWFAQWSTTFFGYFGPPVLAVGIAAGVNHGWEFPVGIALASLYALIPWASRTFASAAILAMPAAVIGSFVVLFRDNHAALSVFLVIVATHIAVCGVAQAFEQMFNVVKRPDQTFNDARILAGISPFPAILYAGAHLTVAVAGLIVVGSLV